MFLSNEKVAILDALRDGPLDQYEIAQEISVPPFTVRFELRELRRLKLVEDQLTRRSVIWRLTDNGRQAAEFPQLRLAS